MIVTSAGLPVAARATSHSNYWLFWVPGGNSLFVLVSWWLSSSLWFRLYTP
jgi:hypothetical protein